VRWQELSTALCQIFCGYCHCVAILRWLLLSCMHSLEQPIFNTVQHKHITNLSECLQPCELSALTCATCCPHAVHCIFHMLQDQPVVPQVVVQPSYSLLFQCSHSIHCRHNALASTDNTEMNVPACACTGEKLSFHQCTCWNIQ
jgi:hypothetical protein